MEAKYVANLTLFSWEIIVVGLLSFGIISFIQKAVCDKSVLRFWKIIFIFLIPLSLISFLGISESLVPISLVSTTILGGFGLLFVLPGRDSLTPVKIRRNIFIFFNIAIGFIDILIGLWLPCVVSISGLALGLLTIFFWKSKYFRKNTLSNRAHFHGYD